MPHFREEYYVGDSHFVDNAEASQAFFADVTGRTLCRGGPSAFTESISSTLRMSQSRISIQSAAGAACYRLWQTIETL